MRNSLLFYNFAYNRPQNRISLEQVCFLVEGVSFILNTFCKKCTKSFKNLFFKVPFSAEKCTNNLISAKSVQNLDKEINTHKYFIIHKFIFFIDRLLTEKVSSLSFFVLKILLNLKASCKAKNI